MDDAKSKMGIMFVEMSSCFGELKSSFLVLCSSDGHQNLINLPLGSYLPVKKIEQGHEKTCLRVSDPVRYKPGCAATEDG